VPSSVAFTVAPRTGDCPLEPRIGFEPPASPFLGMSVGILGTDSMGLRTGYANAQQSCLVLTGAGNRGAGTVRSQVPPACPCRHKIAENAGWDCELLAIELPPRRAPGARRPRHSDHRDGKALCLRRRKRWLITVWLEVRVLPAPPRTPIRTGVSWSLTNRAHFAGVSAGSRTGCAVSAAG
jgi:hypothetical protein